MAKVTLLQAFKNAFNDPENKKRRFERYEKLGLVKEVSFVKNTPEEMAEYKKESERILTADEIRARAKAEKEYSEARHLYNDTKFSTIRLKKEWDGWQGAIYKKGNEITVKKVNGKYYHVGGHGYPMLEIPQDSIEER